VLFKMYYKAKFRQSLYLLSGSPPLLHLPWKTTSLGFIGGLGNTSCKAMGGSQPELALAKHLYKTQG